jgi:hypothetical protein
VEEKLKDFMSATNNIARDVRGIIKLFGSGVPKRTAVCL